MFDTNNKTCNEENQRTRQQYTYLQSVYFTKLYSPSAKKTLQKHQFVIKILFRSFFNYSRAVLVQTWEGT